MKDTLTSYNLTHFNSISSEIESMCNISKILHSECDEKLTNKAYKDYLNGMHSILNQAKKEIIQAKKILL